jgi:predicted extracellular nuclease
VEGVSPIQQKESLVHKISHSALQIAALLLLTSIPLSAQPASAEISAVQGASHLSPLNNQNVRIEGSIVTAVAAQGFYMQTPDERADGDDATSEGIYVQWTGDDDPQAAIGDEVNVIGRVEEFRPGSAANLNLTITEITRSTVEVVSSGNPLPTPMVLGAGGRVPPITLIDEPVSGDPETEGTFDPANNGIDFYESLEGMRVAINNAAVVSPVNQFGEIWVVGDRGANASTLTPRGGLIISSGDFNPERIQLDDDLYPEFWQPVHAGAHYDRPVVGVVSYAFNNYEVLVTDPVSLVPSALEREITHLERSADAITIATYNVENLGGNLEQAGYDARGRQIVGHLGAPDLIVLEEIQDNNGAPQRSEDDMLVEADQTFARLIRGILNAGGPIYHYQQIDPLDGLDGGEPGGNIRVGFLYREDRGLSFIERPGGDATTPTEVTCEAGVPELSISPGRVEPDNGAWEDSRKPLVGEFSFNGETVFVVGVHLNSKGGDNPLFGQIQPPVLHSETQRIQQARVLRAFISQILLCDPEANVIVAGDVNDFDFSEPVALLRGDLLHNMVDLLPANERYSYIFAGNAQLLDQMLVSRRLFNDHAPALDIVHINAEFFDQLSDHDPSVVRFTFE